MIFNISLAREDGGIADMNKDGNAAELVRKMKLRMLAARRKIFYGVENHV
jgi:hypothetical protein